MSDTPEAPASTALLSSNSTLFWRVFIPIFVTVFLLGLNLAFWLTPADTLYLPFPVLALRIPLLVLLLGWLWFVRRTLWRLHRVEGSAEHVFVSNYWLNLRYSWNDVERLEMKRRFGRPVVNLYLKAPGRLGQKISFLPGSRLKGFLEEQGLENLKFEI